MTNSFSYTPPIDLSDLPGYAPPARKHRGTTVFLGRTSTKDNQDPTSSIPGQAAVCARRLDEDDEFAAYYWDVESGYRELDERSLGSAEFYRQLAVPLPRDGGINDLLAAAEQGRITRVICERSDRAARDMLTILTVEHSLDRWGVELVYASEPPAEKPGVLTTSHLRMRRGAQVDAEIFVRTMQEMSHRGQIQHAVRGYTHGPAPYGYETVIDPDAPTRPQRFGSRPKRRLVLHADPRRAETVRQIFQWRSSRQDDTEILGRLCAAPEQHPFDRAWSSFGVRYILANPKYSGYQVWNRKDRRSARPRPISEWVWSPEPVHPAIITVEQWARVQRITADLHTRDPFGRVRDAARARGLQVREVHREGQHVIYQVGDGEERVVVRRGALPPALADALIERLEAL